MSCAWFDGLAKQLVPAVVKNELEMASESICQSSLVRLGDNVLLNTGSTSFC